MDRRHEVSDKMLETLKKVAYKQDDYGMDKYNEPLHHGQNYSWLQMFYEELADGLKYIQCEIDRRNDVVELLKAAMRVDNPKEYIGLALELLTVEGTGK